MELQLPPIKINTQGALRRAGFEFEYTGVSLEVSARAVADIFGGTVKEMSRNDLRVLSPDIGEFTIKLDATLMQEISADAALARRVNPQAQTFDTIAETVLTPIISTWMPNEIVTPPLEAAQFPKLTELCNRLAALGGKGTGASPIYAFGLHINAEMPGIPPERLRDYIAAFIVLQDWLKLRTQMDLTRQLSTYAKLFSNDYATLMLQPDYAPPVQKLIDDYIYYNPSRNRALDMLPLFAWLDEPRVKALVKDGRVRKRPTFHYRLPNCDLDRPEWSIINEWNHWVEVEKLAENKQLLVEMSRSYLEWVASPLDSLLGNWAHQVSRWGFK